jgi:hypothetical protein
LPPQVIRFSAGSGAEPRGADNIIEPKSQSSVHSFISSWNFQLRSLAKHRATKVAPDGPLLEAREDVVG